MTLRIVLAVLIIVAFFALMAHYDAHLAMYYRDIDV